MNFVQYVLRQSTIIQNKFTDEDVERLLLRLPRVCDIQEGSTESRSLVKLNQIYQQKQ